MKQKTKQQIGIELDFQRYEELKALAAAKSKEEDRPVTLSELVRKALNQMYPKGFSN